jgi:hypothetical protein
MSPETAAHTLIEATIAMHASGTPFMRRILPAGAAVTLWDHYPEDDAISPTTAARHFYHCHPIGERTTGEHGHFHIFLPKSALPPSATCVAAPVDDGAVRANVVHLIALAVSTDGLPISFFTVNRWVTDEWMYSAPAIAEAFDQFDVSDAPGDPLVGRWLTALIHLARRDIMALITARDAANAAPEDRSAEVLSSAPIDLQALIEAV